MRVKVIREKEMDLVLGEKRNITFKRAEHYIQIIPNTIPTYMEQLPNMDIALEMRTIEKLIRENDPEAICICRYDTMKDVIQTSTDS